MKERILKYLQETARGVSSADILRTVFNISSPDATSADCVVTGFLKQDARFVYENNLWHLSSYPIESARFDFDRAAVVHLQSPRDSGALVNVRGAIRYPDGGLQELAPQATARSLRKICSEIDGRILIVWSRREIRLWNGMLQSRGLETWKGDTVYLRDLAARALKPAASALRPQELASELGLYAPNEDAVAAITLCLHECCRLLLNRVPPESRRNLNDLREWMESSIRCIDFDRFAFGAEFLKHLPSSSGVYIMKDFLGAVLYVGKSRNLKRRIRTYFTPRALESPKVAKLHEQLHSIEIRLTDNEVEALLLEARLIEQFRPSINLQIRIHPQKSGCYADRNLLIFVLDAAKKGVRIYFLRDGIFAGRNSALLARPPSKRLVEKLKSTFFTRRKRRKKPGNTWEKEIVSRWFQAGHRRLNYLDVDDAGDISSALAQLELYLCDPDRLQHKVIYR